MSHEDDPHPMPEIAGDHADEALEHAKDALRTTLVRRRRQQDARRLATSACGIARQTTDLVASLGLQAGDAVAAYVSRKDEPGTHPTLDVLHDAGLEILLPVLGAALDRRWGHYTGMADLAQRAPNRPLEPVESDGGPELLARACLILVPALAVDDEGYRLGLGGGWYDRTLLHAAPDAAVFAVVYDEEAHHAPLPRAAHDVPVGGVLTPTSWWTQGRRAA